MSEKISPHKLYEIAMNDKEVYKALMVLHGHASYNPKPVVEEQPAKQSSLKEIKDAIIKEFSIEYWDEVAEAFYFINEKFSLPSRDELVEALKEEHEFAYSQHENYQGVRHDEKDCDVCKLLSKHGAKGKEGGM